LRPLLPRKLDLDIVCQTTARFMLTDEDAVNMKSMPSLVIKLPKKGTASSSYSSSIPPLENTEQTLDSCYVLPPVFYPQDNGWAVKIGHGKIFETKIENENEYLDWYRDKQVVFDEFEGGEGQQQEQHAVRRALVDALKRLCPNVTLQKVIFNRCATSNTKHGHPYIDILSEQQPQSSSQAAAENVVMVESAGLGGSAQKNKEKSLIGCCVGCNGYAAKSSDEIGRIAARMILFHGNEGGVGSEFDWSDGLDPKSFRAVFQAATSS
jgi:hypothetical protein